MFARYPFATILVSSFALVVLLILAAYAFIYFNACSADKVRDGATVEIRHSAVSRIFRQNRTVGDVAILYR